MLSGGQQPPEAIPPASQRGATARRALPCQVRWKWSDAVAKFGMEWTSWMNGQEAQDHIRRTAEPDPQGTQYRAIALELRHLSAASKAAED
eukprot:COSAG05_NODE_11396_length_515_cov_1.115385_1_plen_90_part_10